MGTTVVAVMVLALLVAVSGSSTRIIGSHDHRDDISVSKRSCCKRSSSLTSHINTIDLPLISRSSTAVNRSSREGYRATGANGCRAGCYSYRRRYCCCSDGIALLVAVAGVAQGSLEVMITVTISPSASVVVVNVAAV